MSGHPPVVPLSRGLVRLLAISVGIVVASLYYIQPLLPDVAREFGLSPTRVGIVAMLGMAGAGIGQIVLVPLGDIRERRALILRGILFGAGALAFTAAAQTTWWLMFAMFALGMTASVNHVTIPFAATLAPEGERGRVVGTVISGLLVGVLTARTYAGWVGEVWGWRSVFAIATVFLLILWVGLRRVLPHSEPASHMPWPKLIASAIPLWRQLPELREAVMVNSLMFCAFSGFWTAMVFFVEGPPYHYTSRGAGLFGLLGAAGAMCAPFAGRLADRYGGRTNVLAAVLMMMASFMVLGLFGTSLAGFVIGVIALDLAQQLGHVSNQTRIYGLMPEARSRLNMIYMTCSFSGGAAGSYWSTWWWDRYGWTGVCGYSLALMLIALGVLYSTATRRSTNRK